MATGNPIPATPAAARRTGRQRWRGMMRQYGALIALAALVVFNLAWTPGFRSTQTLQTNLTQVAPIVIVATGMTLVIATGGIDLSVGSLMAIAGTLAPIVFQASMWPLSHPATGTALAFAIPVLVAGLFGWFNGFLITNRRLQPIIATLVLFIAGRGIALTFTDGGHIEINRPDFQYIAFGRPYGIPVQVILMLMVALVAVGLLRLTTIGRYIVAIGGGRTAAWLAGVPVTAATWFVYITSGCLAGLAGLIEVAIISSADPNRLGLDMELHAIAAVAVGGTPLTGGQARVMGTLVGAVFIQLIRYTLVTHGVPYATAQVVNAGLILVAVLLQRKQA